MDNRAIAIIEDNRDDQLVILEAIRGAGIQNALKFFTTGTEAMAYLTCCEQYFESLPVLIFLDLLLENEDGLTFLETVRNHPATHRIPVIVLSQSARQRHLQESYRLGANSFVAKDEQLSRFNANMQCILDYWLKVCRVPVA
ncbi:response regulator [Vampirovibrio sp.]|uniref:response regulator n=1 Tax=Vampirovibrio sp. TaxID=2717857 RepID=UPI0035930A3D